MYTGRTALPEDTVVAMAYVPFQLNRKTYDAGTALCKGTLFPVLNKPFKGACMR
ncbi:MAG: spore coat associated protein CotJA [Clostridia bacterium]|nr:spore coat associated protein CotJA [Clostridia bacterium]